MNLGDWFANLWSQPWFAILGILITGTLGMLFGKALPWYTEHRKVTNEIALSRLKQFEEVLTADTQRAAVLIRGFDGEPEPPSRHSAATERDPDLVDLQRVRFEVAQALPDLLAGLADTRADVVSLRKTLYGNTKSDVGDRITRLEASTESNNRRLSDVIERLASMPRIYAGSEPPEFSREGDIWLYVEPEPEVGPATSLPAAD